MPNRKGTTRSIYALIDPRDDTVRYVGCAIDVEKRFAEHLRDRGNTPKCRWLADLKRYGLVPRVEILEVVDGFYSAFTREDRWIRRLLAAGAPLTNTLPTQGAFAEQRSILANPFHSSGTKLRALRRRLRVTSGGVARRASVSNSTYSAAERGYTVNYQVALAILDAINSFLVEYGESEVSLEVLDWMAE